MSLITLCIMLLCLQPFIIYWVMFSKKEKSQSDLEFELSFLVIAPCFTYFYLDMFWYALALLSGVSALGALLAKLFEKKARYSLPLKRMCHYLVPWFLIFSIGYGVVNLWEFIQRFFETAATPYYVVEQKVTGALIEEVLVEQPTKPLLSYVQPSVYYMIAMVCLLFIKVYESHRKTKEELTSLLLLMMSIAGGVLPLFSEYYIVSLIINFIVFISFTGAILRYKETDPSIGGVAFFYGYAFMMATGFSIMCQSVIWLFSF